MHLTPLDVRKKKSDFRRGLRGYETAQVDDFLELVADRLEVLVREASTFNERIARLEQQVADYRDREKALTEALVTAQQMREDIRTQSTREVELLKKQAEQEAEQIRAGAVRGREREEHALEALRSRQFQFLSSYRKYLEQELSELSAMMHSAEMHSGGRARSASAGPTDEAPAPRVFSGPIPAGSPDSTPFDEPGPVPDALLDEGGAAPPGRGEGDAAPQVGRDSVVPPPVGQVPGSAAPVRPGPRRPAGEARPTHGVAPPSPRISSAPERGNAPGSGRSGGWSPEALTEGAGGGSATAGAPAAGGAPLEQALARWEPELGGPQEVAELDLDGDTIEVDDEDGELLLSAEDVVAAAAEAPEPETEPDDAVDLAFLDFGEDDIKVEAPALAIDKEQLERDVNAGIVAADSAFIDLGRALGDESDEIVEFETPPATGNPSSTDTRDETDAAIDDAFDFDFDDDARFDQPLAGGTAIGEPAPQPPAEATQTAVDGEETADLEADIAFVESLLGDDSPASGRVPESGVAADADTDPSEPSAERVGSADMDAAFGAEFDELAVEGAGDDTGRESDGPDLIDLDSFGDFGNSSPLRPSEADVSSLTLHPMFFEQEPSNTGDDAEESGTGHDQWSSTGGG